MNFEFLQVLQSVSNGAEAVRFAALAVDSVPDLLMPPRFMHNALSAPLSELLRMMGEPALERQAPPKHTPTRSAPRQAPQVKRRLPKRHVGAVHVQAGLPAQPDLRGFDLLAGLWKNDAFSSRIRDEAFEASACRALLLEVIRRASFDWVLYRSSSKLGYRKIAEGAYHWLFVEVPDTKQWDLRKKNGKELTGFCAICDLLELDPEKVRSKVRTLTKQDIMSAGRPAERRKVKGNLEEAMHIDDLHVFDVDVSSLPVFDPLYSSPHRTDS